MKYLNLPTDNGALKSYGRALAYDDLYALEQLALLPQTIIRGIGDCIVDACRIEPTDTNYLPSGTVMLNNRFYEFQGGQLNGQQYLIPGTPSYDADRPAPTAPGGSRTVAGPRNEYAVLTNNISGSSAWIKVNDPATTIRLEHRWQDRMIPRGTIQWLANGTLTDYNSTGKGIGKALGWALCNGANGTVNLQGRFPVGYNPTQPDYNTVGKTGGLDFVNLTAEQNGSHTHFVYDSGNHFHKSASSGKKEGSSGGGREPYSWGISTNSDNYREILTNEAGNHNHSMQASGQGEPHENRPPYFVLAARQWIGLD